MIDINANTVNDTQLHLQVTKSPDSRRPRPQYHDCYSLSRFSEKLVAFVSGAMPSDCRNGIVRSRLPPRNHISCEPLARDIQLLNYG